jgi:hypothetical protein
VAEEQSFNNVKNVKKLINAFTAGHLYGYLYLNAGDFKGLF